MLRERTGSAHIEVDTALPTTVGELIEAAVQQYPSIAPHRTVVRCAVNQSYADPADSVGDGDEVAFITPVSGG